ncbi:MAG: hypothetical protein ACFHWX_09250 [Bacteroidota bacterium]
MKLNWQYFPKSDEIPIHLIEVIKAFEYKFYKISSADNDHSSDEVLRILRPKLEANGYKVEKSKKLSDKIKVPVLFGRNGNLEKYFDADCFNEKNKTVIEVEAGRGVTNYQFLKDLFQASMMHDVIYLVIAIRNVYKKRKDFEFVDTFFNTLFASNRIKLPLKGILIIGY